jgi:hypothetical protein
MKLKIRSMEDFLAGLMFIAFGVAALVIAQNYTYGTTMRMGPGYFPTWLGFILIGLGSWIVVMGLNTDGPKVLRPALRPLLMISLAFLGYGLVIENFGFVAAIVAIVVLSSLSTPDWRWKEVVISTVVLAVGSVLLFIELLGLPFQLWGR